MFAASKQTAEQTHTVKAVSIIYVKSNLQDVSDSEQVFPADVAQSETAKGGAEQLDDELYDRY